MSNLSGEDMPLGSRLIAIVDAFDAMTCGQIYRPAFSHERAVKELFAFAGTQFDPRLVQCFSELHEHDLEHLHRRMAAKWLQDLDAAATESCWQLSNSFAGRTPLVTETLVPAESCSTTCTTRSCFSTTTCKSRSGTTAPSG